MARDEGLRAETAPVGAADLVTGGTSDKRAAGERHPLHVLRIVARWARRRRSYAWLGALSIAVIASPAYAQSFETGFFDQGAFAGPAASASVWYQRAVASGASVVRVAVTWSEIAPAKPADPSNPGDPAYRWAALDTEVEGAVEAGLEPILSVINAPAWAEGGGMPANATPGSWEPSPGALGSFATALARRYSGNYADPAQPGTALPAVRYFQAWNEPNLSIYLEPQWTRTRNGFAPASPALYRSMLNAFYAGVTSVLPDAFIVTAGTAPFGDPPGGQRMPPVQFVRSLLCISPNMKPLACPDPAHFDALSHHPYSVGSPYAHALDPGDVSIPDLYKLERPLAVAERTGRALPAGHKQIWVTEVGYDSDPPNPQAVPMTEFETWVEETLYGLWSEHVSVVAWFLIEDQPPIPNYASTYQSGMYFLDGQPKPAQRAFLFPLVVDRRKRSRPLLWLRAPAGGKLVVSGETGGVWRTLFSQAVTEHQIVERSIRGVRATRFKASVGGVSSLVWPTS